MPGLPVQPTAPLILHPLTWVAWLAGVLTLIALTRNPLYLTVLLLLLLFSSSVLAQRIGRAPLIAPGRFALWAILLTAAFNLLTARYGTTVLVALPDSWPLIGGALTLEGLATGAINGLALAAIFTTFSVLTLAVPTAALIRWIPRAFFPLAVAAAIALSTVPTVLRQARAIREAQAIRGHRLRTLRDGIPLLTPLLIMSLERAFQLAEAMTARGFASTATASEQFGTRLTLVGGLAMLLFGWLLRLAWGQAVLGAALMLIGGTGIVAALWLAGRRTIRTRYREDGWGRFDVLALSGIVGTLLIWLLPLEGSRVALAYLPYPTLLLPGFDLLSGLALLGALGPALAVLWGQVVGRTSNGAA